jgi:hypothetical protein
MDRFQLKRVYASKLKASHRKLLMADPKRFQVAKFRMLEAVVLPQQDASTSASTSERNDMYRDCDLICVYYYISDYLPQYSKSLYSLILFLNT